MPFEEDGKDPSIWSFDGDHHEYMLNMFNGLNGTCQKPVALIIYIYIYYDHVFDKKENSFSDKEDVVGWYSTCPNLRENDLAVHASIFRRLVSSSSFIIILALFMFC